ncbi:MAG: CDP-alcohol phosphatidyltransferase family protein [Bacteroidota bacterium]
MLSVVDFSLSKWTFAHAVFCLAAASVVGVAGDLRILLLAGLLSFGYFLWRGNAGWTPHGGFGRANAITLARLIAGLSLCFLGSTSASGLLVFILALGVLIVDGLDGWMARRHNEASEFGEYFDKETDAFFLLILCFVAYFQEKAGLWIILPGLLRYLFVLVLVAMKPEVDKEYRSRMARVIYVTMIIALLSVFITPAWFYSPLLVVGVTGLFLSFAHYFRWLFNTSSPKKPATNRQLLIRAGLAFVFLNSLLFIPSLIANFNTSTFFPIPDPSQPLATMSWTRGWYDYLLYFAARRPNQDIFRICADMVLLATLLVWWKRRAPGKKRIPALFTVAYLGLLVYEAYDAMVFQFFHRHGILYEDIQYILNLYYLAIDAFSIEHLFRLILILTTLVIFTWSLPPLFRMIVNAFSLASVRKWGLRFSVLFWPVFIGAWYWYGPGDERPTVRSITGKMVSNASESLALARTIAAVQDLPVDWVYESFEATPMVDTPNIYLFMIESYGSILQDNVYLRPTFDSLMAAFDEQFIQAGWHTASRSSTSPVSGGLSWLSMNSVLSGLFMDNKTFYTRYRSRIDTYPHMVSYLQKQGYYTLTLQPPTKERLGLAVENLYQFDKTVYFDDLHYTGTPYSIWIIPDQYSLGYTHEHYLPLEEQQPFFLFFETATTHAPWSNLPPFVADWRTLNDKQPQPKVETASTVSLVSQFKDSYNNRFGQETPETTDLYLDSIIYDLHLLKTYILEDAPDNSVVIILGDHQPPLIPSTDNNTPIHVLAQDTTLIQKFEQFGFRPGMRPANRDQDTLTHAGVYSMLLDVMTATPALPSTRYRPEGIPPSILTTDAN